MCIFANRQMRENANGMTRLGQTVVAGQRYENFVTHAADIDDGLCRQRVDQFAVEEGDNGMIKKVEALKG